MQRAIFQRTRNWNFQRTIRNAKILFSSSANPELKVFWKKQLVPISSLTTNSAKHLLVLGPNGSGKSTLCSSIADDMDEVRTISFPEHVAFLAEHGETPVFRALGGLDDSQDLIVRFGLGKLWHRKIKSLSTGEIRKVMLAYAIAQAPQLIILECPADGLDIPSRNTLRWVIGDLCRGLRPLLVSNIKFHRRKLSQLVLVSHRPTEEATPEFESLACAKDNSTVHIDSLLDIDRELASPTSEESRMSLRKKSIRFVVSKELHERYHTAFSTPQVACEHIRKNLKSQLESYQRKYRTVEPCDSAVAEFCKFSAHVIENKKRIDILQNVNWKLEPSKHYRVTGNNGAGKSSLMDKLITVLLADSSSATISSEESMQFTGQVVARPGVNVCIVSTNSHIDAVHLANAQSDISCLKFAVQHLQNDDGSDRNSENKLFSEQLILELRLVGAEHLVERPFAFLSQGEQRLVLFAAALANDPDLLILDEVCQGLDPHNRLLLLERLNFYCEERSDLCSVYITHHVEEDIASTTHDVHLGEGTVKVSRR